MSRTASHPYTTYSGLLDVSAICECGWNSQAKNATGNAAQHAARTGHVVDVQQTIGVTYAPVGMDRDEVFERAAKGRDKYYAD